MNEYVVVIGGSNLDIGGQPYAPLVKADSNPGKIRTGCGGVGRNIAHTLARLGVDVYLVTALGDDHTGSFIKAQCESAGINMDYSMTVPGESSSMYLYINDDKGDMALALSHMEIVKRIDPDYLESLSEFIKGAAAVAADGNLSQDAFLKIKKICGCGRENNRIPLFVDPVSTAHAHKLKGHLDGIYAIKPNRIEAGYLTDIKIETEDDYRAAANEIIRQGAEKVFISMGSKGMFAADKDHSCIVDRFPADVVNTTGAGDSAAAGIIWASLAGRSLSQTAASANAVASVILSSPETVNPALSADLINRIIETENPEISEFR